MKAKYIIIDRWFEKNDINIWEEHIIICQGDGCDRTHLVYRSVSNGYGFYLELQKA